jgi:hypothetical protein
VAVAVFMPDLWRHRFTAQPVHLTEDRDEEKEKELVGKS